MIKVGITGGIGSGKSLVCDIFRKLGIQVYVADDRAKTLMNSDHQIKGKLISKFGESLYKKDLLNRGLLAGIIFEDKVALDFVNSIVHPAVAVDFEEWCNLWKADSYVIEEAALLFESGAFKQMDKMITVYAPDDLRIKRVVQRDNASIEQVRQRMSHQMNDEEKVKLSDYVIYNDDNHSILEQVLNFHNYILSSQ